MYGKPHFACYYITLEKLISEKHHMANLYTVAARRLDGDKKEVLLRLANEEYESEAKLTNEYVRLFAAKPVPSVQEADEDITITELVRLTADCALHFSHMYKSAPNKRIADILKDSVQKNINQGYLLLLIL